MEKMQSLFDGIRYDSKPIPNEPIATVVLPLNKVINFNVPIVEKPWTWENRGKSTLTPEKMEEICRKLSEHYHI